MTCSQLGNDLSAYVDSELSAARTAEIEAHVNQCPLCQARLAELRKLADGVAALPKLQPQPRFLAEVKGKIRGSAPGRVRLVDVLFRPYWPKIPIEVLALIIVLFLVSILPLPGLKQSARRRTTPAEMARSKSYEDTQAMTPPQPAARTTIPPAPPAPPPSQLVAGQGVALGGEGLVSESAKETTARSFENTQGKTADRLATGALAGAPAAPTAPNPIVVSASDYGQAKAKAIQIAAQMSGNVFSVKPAEQVPEESSRLVTADSSMVTESSEGGGGRFWVDLPASNAERFVAEFRQAVVELQSGSRLNAAQRQAEIRAVATNERKDQASAGDLERGVVAPGVSSNATVLDQLQPRRDEKETLKLQQEPRLTLEINVVPPTNAPLR